MSEYEDLKERKMRELEMQAQAQMQEQQQQLEAEKKISSLLSSLLTDGAKARLNNVKLVNKRLYFAAAQGILSLVNSGQFQGKLTDAQVKTLLLKISSTQKKDFKISRK